ncbi:tyrosine-type recombinase/integrase [Allomesorhizobium alhagi]|uniref:Putative integrase/recombinase n=1 Tax=Mesorhizobium alhagi CCNWXJ12-2 TaxID=1107882 RepID=H0I3Z0_9HYPH|nr:tyrosine-type recombinase/integrase [Mesorhizobium alhagi]EHK52306.1 putative integrase/recombinase [Mesorhizobium alhagi CCNWXJ12-2]
MLSQDLARYVELQHKLGFRFRVQNTLLKSFVAFAERHDDRHVQAARVLEWARLAPSPQQRRNRLLTVRRFALALSAEDRRHEIPPADALGHSPLERRIPHIYSADEIAALMQAAARLKPTGSIRPLMYETLFGLIAATGMRISEALSLQLDDLTADGLIIRQTKFHKSRLLPLHATTRDALDQYLVARRRLGTLNSALLVSAAGASPAYSTVIANFLQLARSIGLRGGPGQPGPCIHDLRHTFAVRSLEQCRHDRDVVGRHIAALSTYLGHAHVTDTYWYLQATPILMRQIAAAGEALHQGAVS